VSGWYKLHTRRVLLVVGLLVAVIFNVDTLTIVTQLSRSAELRKSLADAATQVVETKRFNGVELQANEGDRQDRPGRSQEVRLRHHRLREAGPAHRPLLPQPRGGRGTDSRLKAVIGRCWLNIRATAAGDWLVKVLGWLVTGLAVSLGALLSGSTCSIASSIFAARAGDPTDGGGRSREVTGALAPPAEIAEEGQVRPRC
jgi:hypothetical protein